MDSKTDLHELKEIIRTFCEERDWDKYHNAKDLAIGIAIEASELLEHFIFKSDKEVEECFNNTEKKEQISEEMADVLFLLLRLSQRYNIELSDELIKKIGKNVEKYPIEKIKGSNKKYTEL
ncbi:MAG: nucleotide pyrophosphohydrolase (plasmid) [Candidatus Methanoperedens sp.]|uniref:nucleotide pyrophosphohydrolase n=1 Tax=Candidatus Methanoperedens sp. BLZ2 TaxID=2035255 RepID=UPI000BE24618|nr:nucleotide pyrophosphohydrolase [Candidatus Methanoperedens sp. BLZ2]KAB2946444.1 MAG: nucleotide pyrophosphohydrolase [Candidatus Methanoperedens sp.]MBZ0175680.1 nucleotide pyrophosphohydrolase [Candidatus Methanoperedens nitroreducens]WAH95050.1 MAG: nucleotide pyrophosphohydrolase [Candidatus Methanoperedens sp.]WAM22228.1 MAG: nucleotide pyrophosphohydrolase [Candidatus Methanoperedens sp.]